MSKFPAFKQYDDLDKWLEKKMEEDEDFLDYLIGNSDYYILYETRDEWETFMEVYNFLRNVSEKGKTQFIMIDEGDFKFMFAGTKKEVRKKLSEAFEKIGEEDE